MDGKTIVGEESGRIPPRTPIDCTPPPVKPQLSEPVLKTVDNPGQWSEFTFSPVFEKGGDLYKRHALPTGVMTLSQDSSGTRRINGWEFHYNYWDDGVGPHITPVGDAE